MSTDDVRIIHKTREDYNLIAKLFSDTRQYIWTELKELGEYVKNGDNVLDWGCGSGRIILMLKDKNIHYFGIDQSDELLKIAEKTFSKEIKDGWVQFSSNATKEKEFSDDFFDVVFMIASFHHLPNRETRLDLLKKIFKEIKTGGSLIITVWNLESEWAKEKINKGWKVIGENDFLIPWKNSQGEVLVERYYHHFSKEELEGLLKEAGFKIERLEFGERADRPDKKGGRNLIAVATK
jgi:ubiquinone/menaquinone biosynthesis C-methylase UbiE